MIEQVAIERLVPAAYNPRVMPEHERAALQESVRRWGFVEPMVVNRRQGREGVVVGGHQRLVAARALGMAHVPVLWVDLDEAAEVRLNLALNKLGGRFDEGKLALVLENLRGLEMDLGASGFLPEEIANLTAHGRMDAPAVAPVAPQSGYRCPRCRREWA